MKPSGDDSQVARPAVSLVEDPAFRAYVLRLQSAIPPFDLAAEETRIGAATGPASVCSPAMKDTEAPLQVHDSLEDLADAWPRRGRADLQKLSDVVKATRLLWGPHAGSASDELRRARASLQERRDSAVRFASAMLYSSARAASVGEDVIDQVAIQVARDLSAELFGDLSSVFAVPRGTLVEAEHELLGRAHPNGRIRALTFGIRAGDRVASKASVEADVLSGDQP